MNWAVSVILDNTSENKGCIHRFKKRFLVVPIPTVPLTKGPMEPLVLADKAPMEPPPSPPTNHRHAHSILFIHHLIYHRRTSRSFADLALTATVLEAVISP
ncbi:hypothetical protein RIF29_25417 [Crotalaria pallida]|uniref:Uncharacterized protein n=1 Tax=Crotalaria pallida TaxID=3830 RepID=A0AAN9ELK1_CROPI